MLFVVLGDLKDTKGAPIGDVDAPRRIFYANYRVGQIVHGVFSKILMILWMQVKKWGRTVCSNWLINGFTQAVIDFVSNVSVDGYTFT